MNFSKMCFVAFALVAFAANVAALSPFVCRSDGRLQVTQGCGAHAAVNPITYRSSMGELNSYSKDNLLEYQGFLDGLQSLNP